MIGDSNDDGCVTRFFVILFAIPWFFIGLLLVVIPVYSQVIAIMGGQYNILYIAGTIVAGYFGVNIMIWMSGAILNK